MRHFAIKRAHTGRRSARARAIDLLSTALWTIVSLSDASRASWSVARPNAFGRLRRFWVMYHLALTRGIPPVQYHRYAKRHPDVLENISDYLFPRDLPALRLLSTLRGCDPAVIQDKVAFEKACRSQGIACVATIAFSDGRGDVAGLPVEEWPQSVFVKALRGHGGQGAERWERSGSTYVTTRGGDAERSGERTVLGSVPCIVQPLLEDCDELRALGSVALSSLRIVTALGTDPAAQVVAASLSLATRPGSVTSHEGVHCGIAPIDGTVQSVLPATEHEEADQDGSDDRALVGQRLPFWEAAVDLARRAHQDVFPEFVTLGWDVALTASGPLLLEANINWGMTQHQLLDGPLGKTSLSPVLDDVLRSLDHPAPTSEAEAANSSSMSA